MVESITAAQLVEELCADQRRRWHSGERISAATYLDEHPTLASAVDCAVELVYNEILLREGLGEVPQAEEYLQRFPQLAPQLRRLFEVHGAIESGNLFSTSEQNTVLQGSGLAEFVPSGELPRVPGYELLRELGHGGLGVVYEARHLSLNRVVALKMIRADLNTAGTEVARFRAEAEAVARLKHPNIVQIYEIGEIGGRPFLSLEHVNGGSLSQRLAGTPQPPQIAAEVVATLARCHARRPRKRYRSPRPEAGQYPFAY